MKAGIDSYCSPGYSGAFTSRTVRARVAYARQSEIGWDQFLKGRLACEWGQEMSTLYSASAGLNYTETRRRFVTTAISQLWHMYDELWSLRNNKLHDETDIHALSTEELNRRIRYFYSNKTTLFDGGDFDRFHLGLTHTLALNAPRKRAWLQTLESRRLSTNKARARNIRNMKPLQHYFKPIDMQEEYVKSRPGGDLPLGGVLYRFLVHRYV